MASPNHAVEQHPPRKEGSTNIYELTTDYGYADVTFDAIVGWLGIANIYVEPEFRRQGRAKALLGQVALLAEELDAKLIHAALISRESIDACVAVFGPDAVHVDKEGSYGSVGGASAFLRVARY